MPHYVYQLRDPRNEEICYIGITVDPVKRLYQHMNCRGPKGRDGKLSLISVYLKIDGLEWKMEILAEYPHGYRWSALEEETRIIKSFPPGYLLNRNKVQKPPKFDRGRARAPEEGYLKRYSDREKVTIANRGNDIVNVTTHPRHMGVAPLSSLDDLEMGALS